MLRVTGCGWPLNVGAGAPIIGVGAAVAVLGAAADPDRASPGLAWVPGARHAHRRSAAERSPLNERHGAAASGWKANGTAWWAGA